MKKFSVKKIKPSGVFIWTIIAAFLVVFMVWVVNGFRQDKFDISFYHMSSSKITANMRIVQLADLHLKEFGENNCDLVNEVSKLSPDIIAITGDMANDNNSDYHVVTDLVKQLVEIAPVYYSYGNHEFKMVLFQDSNIGRDIEAAGAKLLSNKYEVINVNGNKIAIGGICIENYTAGEENSTKFFEKYDKETEFKLLLSHSPEIFQGYMNEHPVDLALAGDAHGGQIRLPILGGLYAPGQGLFPEFAEGMHENVCNSTLVISRGLGSSHHIPRFNNNPEIVVIDLGRY